MQHMISPIELEFLLHCYYSIDVYPKLPGNESNLDHPLWLFIRTAEKSDLIYRNIDGSQIWQPTEKGKVWVDHILSTPLPVVRWVRGEHKK